MRYPVAFTPTQTWSVAACVAAFRKSEHFKLNVNVGIVYFDKQTMTIDYRVLIQITTISSLSLD